MTQSEKNLGLRLLAADTEAEVQSIIGGDAAMCDDSNWHPLDGRDTNFNVVGNQSSNGGKAATELMTNMVDAILTRRCLEENIVPKSDKAPPTMYRAVDKFIRQMSGGKIIREEMKWVRDYARKNLVIGVTGERQSGLRPSYTFCDNGEGQNPQDFPRTFLSLTAKNKSEIPFVQGKYNMGSSGVLNFCGENWFKLIISRRYDKKAPWGWTLVRRNTPVSGMPYAEYFAPGGESEIQTIDGVAVFPFNTKDGKRFDDFSLDSGTIIKLYEYNIGQKADFRVIREVFNENLVETILPFRLMSFREKMDAERGGRRALGIDERPVCGMEFLLARSHAEDGEEDESEKILPIATATFPGLGEITVTATVIKKDSEKVAWIKYSNSRIFHHVNGQVQFKQMRGFLTQCGLPALKDRVVVFVDASRLDDAAHQNIWKGDRQSIIEHDTGERYKAAVKDIIKQSADLKALNHRIAKEELESAAKDSSRELVKELIARDKNLAALLSGLVPDVPAPAPEPRPQKPRDDLQHNPTYIRILSRQTEYSLSERGVRVISCDTDAADDFFIRSDNRGYLPLSDDSAAEKFEVKQVLKNGQLEVFISPVRGAVNPGETYSFAIGLHSDAMPQKIFSETISLKITKHQPRIIDPDPKPPKPLPMVGLPPHGLLTKDGRPIKEEKTRKWEETGLPNFNSEDGGYVQDLGDDGMKYFINYDNVWFQKYLRAQKSEAEVAAVVEKYILGMRILMLGSEYALRGASDNVREVEDDFRRLSAKGAAATILTVCDQLPQFIHLLGDDKNAASGGE